MKKIILLELKRTSDHRLSYFRCMWEVEENQYDPILTGLGVLTVDRECEVEVVPLVVGQCSVKENECLETLRIFGIGKEDDKGIIDRLGYTVLCCCSRMNRLPIKTWLLTYWSLVSWQNLRC